MAVYYTTDSELTAVADAIRAKGGTSADLEYPAEFVSAIAAISGSGPFELVHSEDLGHISYSSTTAASVKTIELEDVLDGNSGYGVYLVAITSDQNTGFLASYALCAVSAAVGTENVKATVLYSDSVQPSTLSGIYVSGVSYASYEPYNVNITIKKKYSSVGAIDGNMHVDIYRLKLIN